MHIPDGFLTGEAAAIGSATAIAGVALCLHQAKRSTRERDLPVAGLAAAFFVVGDAPLVPLGVGTQAHLLGGALAVALLGPWLGGLTITVVCLIQALVLGDGGITTLGMTITYLALIPALIGYPALTVLRRLLPLPVAAGLTAALCVMLAAGFFALVITFGVGAGIDTKTIALTTLGSYAIVAVIEGVLTALIVKGLLSLRPDLLRPRKRATA